MSYEIPILINAFNRPENTEKVFQAVKDIKPKHLFLAIDGPRSGNNFDKESAEVIKKIFANIDWDCDVKTLYRDSNLGCPKAIPGAIDWMFSYVEEGIILEDDCLPDKSFFKFCEEMLQRYKENEAVIMIGGNNFFPNQKFSECSYFFSRYSYIWGWATWKRAWKLFDPDIKTYLEFKQNRMKKKLPNISERFFWRTSFDNKYYKYHDGWGVKWFYALISNDKVGIVPKENLVTNIGFGPDATVTKKLKKQYIVEANKIEFPLKHPKYIQDNEKYSRKFFKVIFLSTVSPRIILKTYLRVLKAKIGKWRK